MVSRLVLAGLLATALGVHLSGQQSPVFRNGTSTVSVYATVTDRDGHLVPDLAGDDFVILDNGRPQRITLFNAGVQPIAIVVMLDMSGSMTDNVSRVRASAVQLFTRLLPADKARVGIVGGDRPKFTTMTFTNDVDDLIRSLWIDVEPGGGTPLWDGMNLAISSLAEPFGRRVILVLSDGYDTGRSRSLEASPLERVIERTQSENVMVYSIGLKGKGATPIRGGTVTYGRLATNDPDPGLALLAGDSGGRYFELLPADDLGATFARVADELHRQYEIGYRAPASDGKEHQIEVRATRSGLTVRARRSYRAPSRDLTSRTADRSVPVGRAPAAGR